MPAENPAVAVSEIARVSRSRRIRIACGSQHTVVLLNDGTVMSWGVGPGTNVPAGLTGITAIAAGYQYSLALRTNGTVVAWGDNSEGQCNVPGSLTNAIAISARLHSVALRSDGTVVVWGSNRSEVTTVPPSATNVVAIAAGGVVGSGEIFTAAVRKDGTAVVWGVTSEGESDASVQNY